MLMTCVVVGRGSCADGREPFPSTFESLHAQGQRRPAPSVAPSVWSAGIAGDAGHAKPDEFVPRGRPHGPRDLVDRDRRRSGPDEDPVQVFPVPEREWSPHGGRLSLPFVCRGVPPVRAAVAECPGPEMRQGGPGDQVAMKGSGLVA